VNGTQPRGDLSPTPRSLGLRLKDWRRTRTIARDLRRRTIAPPRHAFGAFGASVIVPPARVTSPECIFIGDGVVIHEYVFLSVVRAIPDVVTRFEVGDRTRMGRYCQVTCAGEIIIEEDVGISDEVLISDTFHDYKDITLAWYEQKLATPKPVRICAGAGLGFAVLVLPGVTIGRGAYVLDHSVVSSDVPARTVAAGNPARVIEAIDDPSRHRGEVRS
jgi:acetyltransferase-like isoleucine patch superfamily enzyme